MHAVVNNCVTDVQFLTFMQFNGFVPLAMRSDYLAVLITTLKEFYTVFNQYQWQYSSMFTKNEF